MTVQGPDTAALEMRHVTKAFGGLRPLRIACLTLGRGERVSIGGIDAGVSELIVNLITGASLPDTGEIRIFGRSTADIANSDEWLDSLDQFGIVSPRGVLLEGSTLLQNLAMPFTLSVDPVPSDVIGRVRALAERCGIPPEPWLQVRAAELPHDMRVRAHLMRALAHDPALVVFEHPTADVGAGARGRLAIDVGRVCTERHVTVLVLTNDDDFARTVAPRNLRLQGATGQLKRLGTRWFPW